MFDPTDRKQFMRLAILCEGGLAAAAMVVGWLLADIYPLQWFSWNWEAVAWGVAAAVPMFGLFLLAHRFPIGSLRPINQFLVEMLGPSLAACRWSDLVVLALLAGGCEELLFRGLLQPWFGIWGETAGLVGSSVMFGLAHCITPLYALLAGLAGLYLSLLLNVTDEPNLLTPIVAHSVYDFWAFIVVARAYQSGHFLRPSPMLAEEDEPPSDPTG